LAVGHQRSQESNGLAPVERDEQVIAAYATHIVVAPLALDAMSGRLVEAVVEMKARVFVGGPRDVKDRALIAGLKGSHHRKLLRSTRPRLAVELQSDVDVDDVEAGRAKLAHRIDLLGAHLRVVERRGLLPGMAARRVVDSLLARVYVHAEGGSSNDLRQPSVFPNIHGVILMRSGRLRQAASCSGTTRCTWGSPHRSGS